MRKITRSALALAVPAVAALFICAPAALAASTHTPAPGPYQPPAAANTSGDYFENAEGYAKYNPTNNYWREASGTATQIEVLCSNNQCSRGELEDTSNGECITAVNSGAGQIQDGTCNNLARQEWDVWDCGSFNFSWENDYFSSGEVNQFLAGDAIGSGLFLEASIDGAQACNAYDAWTATLNGP